MWQVRRSSHFPLCALPSALRCAFFLIYISTAMTDNNNNNNNNNDKNMQDKGQQTENPMYLKGVGILDDFRTLHEVEAALLYHPDGMDEYWDECEVDILVTLYSVRNMKRRLLALAEEYGVGDGCRDILKGGVL